MRTRRALDSNSISSAFVMQAHGDHAIALQTPTHNLPKTKRSFVLPAQEKRIAPLARDARNAEIMRGLSKLGDAARAWVRGSAIDHPVTGAAVLQAILAHGVAYDQEVWALVRRATLSRMQLPGGGDAVGRVVIQALRQVGSMISFEGDGARLIAPTAEQRCEQMQSVAALNRKHDTKGELLRGVGDRVWFDGVGALDLDALLGDISLKRRAVIERGLELVTHRWRASAENIFHGVTPDGVRNDTPDASYIKGGFTLDGENVGLPYFYGGFSDVNDFDRGIARGLLAGHIFPVTATFREDNAFSPLGVGLDCSGFVSRAWGLEQKIGSVGIAEATTTLEDYGQLKPGDVVNKPLQHVMMYVGRRGDDFLFFESTPPRVCATKYTAQELADFGMLPAAAKWLDE